MNFHLSVGLIGKHFSKVHHSLATCRQNSCLLLAIFRLPNCQSKQLTSYLIRSLLHFIRIKWKFKLRTYSWRHQWTLNSTFLQKYLPNVDLPLIPRTEHKFSHILVTSDVNVLSKCWYCVCMGVWTIFLRNCYWCLKLYVPQPNRSIIMTCHEQVSSFQVKQATYLWFFRVGQHL